MHSNSLRPATLLAVTKFLEVNDDVPAILATNRRVFFEALRTGLTLTPTEVEHIQSLADFLHDLSENGPTAQAE